MIALQDIRDCFEGVIPSIIATLDADGVPNVSYLSQVFYVDDAHVALSNQFFSKTVANVRATGRATAIAIDGDTGANYVLDLAFVEACETGELFERMSAHLRAISSQQGMDHVMALRSADIYRVVDCRPVIWPGEPPPNPTKRPAKGERLASAARIAAAVAAEIDGEAMIARALDGIAQDFGFGHAMLLVPDAEPGRLVALASRGYETTGAGAEVMVGKGPIGIAAETQRAVRLCEVANGRRMGEAVRATADMDEAHIIPLPGLAEPKSQLAAPMVSQGRLRGVLTVEAEHRFAFTREDEDALALIGAQLAAGLRSAELEGAAAAAAATPAPPVQAANTLKVRYFVRDDSLFLDDAFIIKGVPGRLLFHFLKTYADTGRRDFSNREIRLDRNLRLPDIKDNLETRLILLRGRLDEKCSPVRLTRPARGQIRLELDTALAFEVID